MINYIKENEQKTIIFYNNKASEYNRYEKIITNLLKTHFIDYKLYKKIMAKKFRYYRNVPIYFSKSLMLFKIRDDYFNYYINYNQLLSMSYNDKMVVAIFKNGEILCIDETKNDIRKYDNMCKTINNYINYLENDYYN